MFYNGKQHTHTFVISTESQLAKARPTMLYIRLVVVVVVVVSAVIGNVIASAKLKLSQLFERGCIYGIEWRLAKSKLSNELERGGTYGMTYDT